jgi:hypothetical protein
MGFPPGHSFNTNDFAEPATGSLNFLAHNQLAGGSGIWLIQYARNGITHDYHQVNDVSVKDSPLDMGFNSPPVQHGHPDIDMGFRSPVQHHDPDQRSLDMGFHSPQAQHHDPDQMSLDMGFYSPPVQHRDPDQMSFDMGFNSPVVQHDHPDQRPSGVDPVDIPDQSSEFYHFIRLRCYMYIQWVFDRKRHLWTWALGQIRHMILPINRIFNRKRPLWRWLVNRNLSDL